MRQPSVHRARKRSALAIFDPLEVFDDNCLDLTEVNLFNLSRQFFLDLLARVFLSFAEILNLCVEFLSDLLAVGEDLTVAVVGVHPYYPAFCFRRGALFLEDQFNPQSAASHSQPGGLGDRPTTRDKLVDRRRRSERRGQARRAGADKYSGKVELFALDLIEVVEEDASGSLHCVFAALHSVSRKVLIVALFFSPPQALSIRPRHEGTEKSKG